MLISVDLVTVCAMIVIIANWRGAFTDYYASRVIFVLLFFTIPGLFAVREMGEMLLLPCACQPVLAKPCSLDRIFALGSCPSPGHRCTVHVTQNRLPEAAVIRPSRTELSRPSVVVCVLFFVVFSSVPLFLCADLSFLVRPPVVCPTVFFAPIVRCPSPLVLFFLSNKTAVGRSRERKKSEGFCITNGHSC